jgi:hypothetical protein
MSFWQLHGNEWNIISITGMSEEASQFQYVPGAL